MSLQREILSPVTTAGILYPALHTQVLQIAMPKEIDNPKSINSSINKYNIRWIKSISGIMVSRQFFQQYSLTASNSITFPKQDGETAAVVQKVAEGVEIPLDVTAYTSVNVVPYKIAHGFIITKEMIEDSLIPIQQDQLVRSALRFANKIDRDKN